MFNNFWNRSLQRATAIQGVKTSSINTDVVIGELPVFKISERRIITEFTADIMEEKHPSEEFESVTVDSQKTAQNSIVATINSRIQTDFFFGYGTIEAVGVGAVNLSRDEEVVDTFWESNDEYHFPVIETSKRTIRPEV